MARTAAISLSLLGAALVVAGVALIYYPAALILAGVGCAALGFFGIGVDG